MTDGTGSLYFVLHNPAVAHAHVKYNNRENGMGSGGWGRHLHAGTAEF